jgi:hypothetical protein
MRCSNAWNLRDGQPIEVRLGASRDAAAAMVTGASNHAQSVTIWLKHEARHDEPEHLTFGVMAVSSIRIGVGGRRICEVLA